MVKKYGVDDWLKDVGSKDKKQQSNKKVVSKTAIKRKAPRLIDIEDDEESVWGKGTIISNKSTKKKSPIVFKDDWSFKTKTIKKVATKKKSSNKVDYKVLYNNLKRECKRIAINLGKLSKELKALR